MTPNLEAEMAAAALRVRKAHVDRLVTLGVPVPAMQRLFSRNYVFGVAPVVVASEGLFEFDETGQQSMIVPVGEFNAELDLDETTDLIAFRTDAPADWLWRVGEAWALGADHLDRDWPPVPVVATPMEWMAMGGDALCVLDWSKQHAGWAQLREGPGLTFTDDALRKKLRNALTRSVALPSMEIDRAA